MKKYILHLMFLLVLNAFFSSQKVSAACTVCCDGCNPPRCWEYPENTCNELSPGAILTCFTQGAIAYKLNTDYILSKNGQAWLVQGAKQTPIASDDAYAFMKSMITKYPIEKSSNKDISKEMDKEWIEYFKKPDNGLVSNERLLAFKKASGLSIVNTDTKNTPAVNAKETEKQKPGSSSDTNKYTYKASINTCRSNIKHYTDKSATLVYLGAGYNFVGKAIKNQAFLSDAADVNLSVYQPLVKCKIITFGLQMGVEYGIGIKDNLPSTPSPFHVSGETSSTVAVNSSGGKQSAFKFEAGPQLNIHIGNHFVISPAFTVGGRLNIGLKEFSAVQTTVLGGTSYNYTLLKKTNSKPIDVVITPKLRLHYMFNKWVGLWVEANYTFLSRIRTDITTLLPLDTPLGGEYAKSQLDNATYPTEKRTTKFGAAGVNAGLVFSFGGKEKSIKAGEACDECGPCKVPCVWDGSGCHCAIPENPLETIKKSGGESGPMNPNPDPNDEDMQIHGIANSLNTQVAAITIKGNGKTTADGLPIVEGKTVSGNIKMKNGISNKGISITIEQKESSDKASVVTDEKGNFSMVLSRDTTHMVYVNGVEYGKIKIVSPGNASTTNENSAGIITIPTSTTGPTFPRGSGSENTQQGLPLKVLNGNETYTGACEGEGTCDNQLYPYNDEKLSAGEAVINFKFINGFLEGEFLKKSPKKKDAKVFTITKEIKLTNEICKKLGVDFLTVLPGKYDIDRSINKLGTIKLKTSNSQSTTKSVVMEWSNGGLTDAGSDFSSCKESGFCSIIFISKIPANNQNGIKLTGRNVAASFVLNHEILEGEFVTEPPEKSKYFNVNGNTKLDAEICEKLGVKSLTILSGKYPIDYSTNKLGSIKLKISYPESKREVAYNWSADYHVGNPDILKYLGTTELIIKKGKYLYDYSKNKNGDVTLELAKPIKDNGDRKATLLESDSSDDGCCNPGETCMYPPPKCATSVATYCTIKRIIVKGMVTQIVLSFK